MLTTNKWRSKKKRIVEQLNENLSGENVSLKIKYNALLDENKRLKDQLNYKDKQLHQTSGNLKDLAKKYGGTGKRNKMVNSQSKGYGHSSSVLRKKNLIIDNLQKQLKGNINQ